MTLDDLTTGIFNTSDKMRFRHQTFISKGCIGLCHLEGIRLYTSTESDSKNSINIFHIQAKSLPSVKSFVNT